MKFMKFVEIQAKKYPPQRVVKVAGVGYLVKVSADDADAVQL